MRKIDIYILKKKLEIKKFFLLAIILNIITTIPTIILSIPGMIALIIYLKKENFKKEFFRFFSIYNLLINLVFLEIYCVLLLFIIIYDLILFIRSDLKMAFYLCTLILGIIFFIFVQIWFCFIAKILLEEIKNFEGEKNKEIKINKCDIKKITITIGKDKKLNYILFIFN